MKKQPSVSDKPYNKCIPCQHRIDSRCDGPRTSAMTLPRWCEFMRLLKEANKLTNQEIAERSGVSIKTIERIMALNCDSDIMRETARLIENAVIGSSNQFPCYLAFEENIPQESQKLSDALRELERVMGDNEEYRRALDGIHDSYKEELQTVRNDCQALLTERQKTIDDLREQVERLKRNNDYLWAENNRKSKVIDGILAKQDLILARPK